MKQIFELSKKDLEISKFEVLSLYNPKKHELLDDLLIFDSKDDFSKRLAYTKNVYEFVFECNNKEIDETIKSFDWNMIYNKSFSVRFIDNTDRERKIAGLIFDIIKTPKVDLRNASTKIVFFRKKDKIICGVLKHENDNEFLKRRAHMRPQLHPTSLHPQLAIACINMTGKTDGTLLDPFCGSGGILIEAGIIGFKTTGYDIDRIMVNRSRINLDYYKIKDYNITLHDATKIKDRFDCIVTDLPYGRNSKLSSEIEVLYREFLKSAYESTDSAVVLFPDFTDYKKFIGKWKVKSVFDYYLHKSLSKKIVVLEKG